MAQTGVVSLDFQKPRPWWKRPLWLVMIVTLMFLTLVAVVTLLPPGDPVIGESFQVGATQMESRNNSSSSGITSGRNAPFRCQRLAVISKSDHLLMRRALPQVVEQLRQLPIVQSVDYIELNNRPKAGKLYDFYILIDMPKFEETGLLPTGRTIDATIITIAGNELWPSNYQVLDQLSAPQANVSFSGTLDHHSVTTGYESAGAKYKRPATDVAEQLGGLLVKNLTEWADKYGTAFALPEALFPPYRPTPDDLPLLRLGDTEQLLSGHGLMMHNLTVWRATSENWLGDLEDLQQRLKAAGWRVSELGSSDPSWAGSFRAERDEDVMEGFRLRGRDFKSQPTGPQKIVVKYADRMSRVDLEQVIEQLLDESASLSALSSLAPNMSRDQRDRLAKRIISSGTTDPAMQLLVARHLHEQDKDDAALARLDRVWFLSRVTGQDGLADEARRFAKEITKKDDWNPVPPDDAMLENLGIQRMKSEDAKIKAELDLNEPLLVYVPAQEDDADSDSSKGQQVVMVRVQRSTIPDSVYSIELRLTPLSGGSSQSMLTPHNPQSPFCATVPVCFIGWILRAEVQETIPQRFNVTLLIQKQDQ